jgi:hypothetical protein
VRVCAAAANAAELERFQPDWTDKVVLKTL